MEVKRVKQEEKRRNKNNSKPWKKIDFLNMPTTMDEVIDDLISLNSLDINLLPHHLTLCRGMLYAIGTTQQKHQFYEEVSRHYYSASLRIYDIFSIYGVAQIYRTKKLCFTDFRKFKIEDLQVILGSSWNSSLSKGE
ncbi:40849_t:CDS:2, partial [Gigaspora margarita]